MWRPRPQAVQPPLAPGRMLRLLTLAAALVVVGLAVGLWQLRKNESQREQPTPAAPERAAAPLAPPAEGDGDDLLMGPESRSELAGTVATVIGMGSQGGSGALAELALIKADPGALFWTADAPDKVPKLRPDYLSAVRDSRPTATWKENEAEFLAYCDALIKANRTPAPAFAKSARRDVWFVHAFEEPWRYRGEVVHIRGQLRLLVRRDPDPMLTQAGVRDVYEGWIYDERYPANPWCVRFTELPPGLEPSEEINRRVSFEGYLFKRYRYKSRDSVAANQFREAPLLIGRTVTPEQALAPVADSDSWSGYLLPGFMLILALSVALTVGLAWWFRREDWKVRSRVLGLHGREFVEPTPDPAPPVAAPVGPTSAVTRSTTSEPRKNNNHHGHDKAHAVHRALGQGGIDSS